MRGPEKTGHSVQYLESLLAPNTFYKDTITDIHLLESKLQEGKGLTNLFILE